MRSPGSLERKRATLLDSPLRSSPILKRSDLEFPRFVHQLTIHNDLPAVPHIADHVPMDGAHVLGAGLGVTCADSHVNRAADLLIEEDVLDEAVDWNRNGRFIAIVKDQKLNAV